MGRTLFRRSRQQGRRESTYRFNVCAIADNHGLRQQIRDCGRGKPCYGSRELLLELLVCK